MFKNAVGVDKIKSTLMTTSTLPVLNDLKENDLNSEEQDYSFESICIQTAAILLGRKGKGKRTTSNNQHPQLDDSEERPIGRK